MDAGKAAFLQRRHVCDMMCCLLRLPPQLTVSIVSMSSPFRKCSTMNEMTPAATPTNTGCAAFSAACRCDAHPQRS